jgi:hypothetical protein
MNNKKSTFVAATVAAVTVLMTGALANTFTMMTAYAQTTTTASQTIVGTAQVECDNSTTHVIIPESCVSLVYESPSTIILNGESLVSVPGGSAGSPNPFLWKAVDGFKAQGYQIDSVVMGGVGSVGNPNKFFVVMSK